MTAPGLNDATDALVEYGRSSPLIGHDLTQRRTARNVATRALKAARVSWEAPIRKIHEKSEGGGRRVCAECMRDWPCPTIKALEEFIKEKPTQAVANPYAAWMAALAAQGPR